MPDVGKQCYRESKLARVLFAGLVFLLPVENAYSVANLSLSTTFASADPARGDAYMESGGTWDGGSEVTDSTGDRFTLIVENLGDTAFDIDLSVTLPTGLRLSQSPQSVIVTSPNCPGIGGVNANQPGSGPTVNFNVSNNTDILPGCIYEFEFGVTTDDSAPFASTGFQSINYNVFYSDVDNGAQLSTSTTQFVEVRTGALSVLKIAITPLANNGDIVEFSVDIQNTGAGGLFEVVLTDTLGPNLTNLVILPPGFPTGSSGPAANQYTFDYLASGDIASLTIQATVNVDPVSTTCPNLLNTASATDRTGGSSDSDFDTVPFNTQNSLQLSHDMSVSFCELCGEGEVRLLVENTGGLSLVNIDVTEDLMASGLTYVPGSTTYLADGIFAGAGGDPVVSGGAGQLLTWTSAQIADLARLDSPFIVLPSFPVSVEIIFRVQRNTAAGFDEEGLVTAVRDIQASANYDLLCGGISQSAVSLVEELPIEQPIPQVVKLGRNVDAGQLVGDYADFVYGNVDDDVIWRVDINNSTGLAGLEDLLINDTIGGNFDIDYICDTEASATAAAGGAPAANCFSAGGGTQTSFNNFAVDDPFGIPANDEPLTFIDAPEGGSGFVYYVGRILSSCTDHTNTADIEWGCEVDAPDGGILVPASNNGVVPAFNIVDTAELSTNVLSNGLIVAQDVTGSNLAQPVGSKGVITLTITNTTGGTVRNITLRDVLPVQYVLDTTFVPTAIVAPAYGVAYNGMIDVITHTNPATITTVLDNLNNIAPEYTLTSTTAHDSGFVNLLRHGDVLTIQIGIIMIEPTYYDKVADLDVLTENTGDGTDPINNLPLTNQVFVDFEDICGSPTDILQPADYPLVDNAIAANPEDLDVNTSDPLYILTNDPLFPLPLTVLVTNNGGHDADDYVVYVSFGEAMTVTTPAAGCSVTSNPPPLAVWETPDIIPASAAVYECVRGVIAPGATETITFEVIKNADISADDDLTFRADVVGEITQSDGTLLVFPTPDTSVINNRANNYTLDGVRSRVLGFNLSKILQGNCTEDNPAPISNDQIIIGEDCEFHIEAGGWFGFQTPGFALIAVENIVVTDDLPDGQGYINHVFNNTGNITSPIVINGGAGSTPLEEVDITWAFNPTGSAITVKDEFFRTDVTTRLLNDPIDPFYPFNPTALPNQHGAISTDIGRASFDAVFDTQTFLVTDTASVPGYPVEAVRRVDLTITEPNLLVVKEVCNETIYGTGTGCTNFTTLADDGDSDDSYIYRITITNEDPEPISGVQRAPAFNVISTDVLDPSDLVLVESFDSDGLDNDGDGAIDEGSEASMNNNIADGGVPGIITISNTTSVPLQRIDPGATVTLYYRTNPDDDVAPLQTLTNTVTLSYDSLAGDFGNQNAPQRPNSDAGGARVYTSIPTQANVQIIPLLTQPKTIVDLSNTTLSLISPQEVSIGEEIEYELHTLIPVSKLRTFVIRDELPTGITCSEAPVVNLNAAPYSAAGFVPGGSFTPTCVGNLVEWNFGDQELTMSGTARFDFPVNFIARVDNTVDTNEGNVITNGGAGSNVTTSYFNEAGTQVVLTFGGVDVVVREPVIAITKSFAVANADAADILTVTVTATNNGTAPAYNLRVLDDLATFVNLSYVGNIGGTDPPDNVTLLSANPNRPVFSWNPANPDFTIAPGGGSISFTFDIQVDIGAQPHEILANTIEASWTSLPGQTTALNSTGSIGVDGSATGMRNGALPNAGDAINDYETTANDTVEVPALSMTKTDLDNTVVPTIGALKNFQVEIVLTEGTTNGVVISDDLEFSTVSYFLENNAAFDITYTFQDIASINGQPPSEAVFNAFPADDTSVTAVWDIGTVVTAAEDDLTVNAVNPVIRINYFARINNDLGTDDGDPLRNEATFTYINGDSGATETLIDPTLLVQVVEPLVTVTKTFTNVTPGKAATDLPDGGDIIQYVVTVASTGNSTAHDVNVVDNLPAELQFDASFTPTAEINSVAVAGFVPTPAGAPVGPLVWGQDNADGSLDIPVGQSLVLTYRVVVQDIAEANEDLANSVLIDWTSLNGVNTRERTGVGCPTITLPNDYCVGPAVATVAVIDANSITKTRTSDTYGAADINVRIGDIVEYTLSVNLQEGLTRNITLSDTLPNGMEYLDVVSVNGDTAAPYSSAGVFTHADINAPTATTGTGNNIVSWTLGDITNQADNNTANDAFVIVYRAQVVNDELPIPQDASTSLLNTVVLDYVDVSGAPPAADPRLTDTETINAQQPIIFIADLTKERRSGIVSGTEVASGELMDFRLSACNAGDAPAYDLVLDDILPVELDETTITVPVVTINGVAATAGVDYVYTPPLGAGGTMSFLFNNEANPVQPGQCAVIEYDINVDSTLGINASFDNQFQATVYHSLDSDNVNVAERETYALAGPVLFNMNTLSPVNPPEKILLSPASRQATIGEIITYQITVPSNDNDVLTAPNPNPMSSALFDVLISDDMVPNLTFVSASLDASSTYTGAIDTSASTANQVRIFIDLIPVISGETAQAVINVQARVNNDAITDNTIAPFGNTVSYTFAATDGGGAINAGSDTTLVSEDVSIIEPELTLQTKTVVNVTQPGLPPDAGDVLRYTLTLDAAGGGAADIFSDAFDLSIIDTLSLGLVYNSGGSISLAGNTVAAPQLTGDGITTPQTMTWDLANGTDIDIPEGTTSVTFTYDVEVLDSVLPAQDLVNSALIQWTGLEGANAFERDGTATPAYNDYFSGPLTTTLTTPDNNVIAKTRSSDTSPALTAANDVRIGDVINYELRLSLQEGTSSNVVLTDTLPQGLVYDGIVSVNGDTVSPHTSVAPFTHSDITAASVVVVGDPATGPTTATWTLGNIVNANDNNATNNDFVIIYRARVLNNDIHPQVNNIALTNSVDFDYQIATGTATRTDNETINVLQPNLAVTKTAAPAGGDTEIGADELIVYSVFITNNGTAAAYDTVLVDTIPVGLRNGAATITMVSTTLQPSGTVLSNLAPVYDASTGIATWNFDSGVADQYSIPPGESLRIVYQVQADSNIASGLTNVTNAAQVQLYYSFDDEAVPANAVVADREVYGPSNTASVTLTTGAPIALDKQNTQLTASIGEPFSYRIIVPAVAQPTVMHDVRILDDLTVTPTQQAELIFISVTKISGSETWTPVNTGTPTNLIIEDITNGIEIPANERIEVEVTVMLRNTATNIDGLVFNNTASYTFNQVDGDNGTQVVGLADTTADMTVVEPTDLTLEKSGPATIQPGTAETFTLNVQNIGTGPAWDVTIVDQLPDPAPGGMCDNPPTNIIAQIFESNGTTAVSPVLVEGADYVASFVGAPTCELTLTMQTAVARIDAGQRLIITYDAELDAGNVDGTLLTNIAGAVRWFSWDTAGAGATGEIREYTRVFDAFDPGTVGTLDHEDAFTVTARSPQILIQKTVVNLTTSQNPGSDASPGDTLRYTIVMTNNGVVDATGVVLTDSVPANTTYVADSVALNGIAVGQPDAGVSPLIAGIDVSSSDLTPPLPTPGNGILTSGQTATVIFDVVLDPVITSGTIILNQGQVNTDNFSNLLSDDPNVNGVDDPLILGDEDPTETLVTSAPLFHVEKTSQDLTGDPGLLLAGDTLRYTITVQNVGSEDSVNTLLRDQIPSNTSYVANTTTLNGVLVTDPAAGVSALESGMLINAPENTTAGFMRADSTATTNIATITFDVVVSPSALNGTVISNQGFVTGSGAGSGAFPEQPSDDPDVNGPDDPLIPGDEDPTIDIVGNLPLVDAQKTVAILVDNGSPGLVDPGDTLQYTITITNFGAVDATGVVLTDTVPANTTYVANSIRLNTEPLPADGGVLPLIAGIDVSSSDLTLPLPTPGNGILSPGQSATITFDVLVNTILPPPPGTIISNQGFVDHVESPDTEPTDADGIDSNGDQPTDIVVGNVQLLSITKEVFVVGGGVALAGGELEYVVRVTNIGSVPAINVVITDDLDVPLAGQLIYVPGSALLDGSSAGTSFTAPVLTADYSATYGDLPPGVTTTLRFRAQIEPTLTLGTSITNTAQVDWNSPTDSLTDSVTIVVGAAPGVASLIGKVWHDANFNDTYDSGSELALENWSVDIYLRDLSGLQLIGTAQTDVNGDFLFSGVPATQVGESYELIYRAPGAGAQTALLGLAASAFTNARQQITGITAAATDVITGLNLPIDPDGIVYDAITRLPVAGAAVTMLRASDNSVLPAACFDDTAQQNQTTLASGYYKFDLNFSQAACTPGADYIIQVTQPDYNSPSISIPPVATAYNVDACLADAVAAPAGYCEAQASEFQPTGAAVTTYYLTLTLTNTQIPQDSQLFNNHIPLDPRIGSAISISKTSALLNVTRGQLVPYVITVNNSFIAPVSMDIVDNFPAGFKYVQGSACVTAAAGSDECVATEPLINGTELTWPNVSLAISEQRKIKLLLVVGSGVSEGEYVNTAHGRNTVTPTDVTEIASATVRVVPDPDFDCSDVIGKVFDDKNANGYQDEGEAGIAGTRVVTARGLLATTDEHGRFHITCAVVANQDRGSNFILKLDERTLPSGYRMTTENPRVQRATRGKMLKYNFGASIHRVVRLDLADGVFEKNSTEIRPQWTSRIDLLLEKLQEAPSVLRLSYLAEIEKPGLVDDRLDEMKDIISERWEALDCCYKLMIETEVYWRTGGPPDRGVFD